MKVIVLGITPSPVTHILEMYGETVAEFSKPVDVELLREQAIEFAISYRYRHIVEVPVIKYLEGKIINLHISFLPWNRGADPNLWSFLESTSKGVSIHYVDEGLDTGDIIAQKEVTFEALNETLSSTYRKLNDEILELFRQQWPLISKGRVSRRKQPTGGSYHNSKDRKRFEFLIQEKGWDTPVTDLIGKAAVRRGRQDGCSWD